MCLIAVKRKGYKLPIYNHLWNGYQNNRDGVGIALYKDGATRVYIKKDFKDFESFYMYMKKNVKVEDTLIIHFRYATSGNVDNGNCHPFPITHNKRLLRETSLRTKYAVAHNGVLNAYARDNSKYSDTQKFVFSLLADLKGSFTNKAVKRLITDHIKGDKLAILQGNGELILLGEYQEDNDILYSNTGYLYNRYSKIDMTASKYRGGKKSKKGKGKGKKKNNNSYNSNEGRTVVYDKDYYHSDFCEGCQMFAPSNWNVEFGGFTCEECEKDARFDKAVIGYYNDEIEAEKKFNDAMDKQVSKIISDMEKLDKETIKNMKRGDWRKV